MTRLSVCPLCTEPVEMPDLNYLVGSMPAHRECLLRAVMGGIGHLTDHEHWCLAEHDPDAEMTYRESALEVDRYLADLVQAQQIRRINGIPDL